MAVKLENVETILISSRIRLARNFSAYPFPQKMDDAQASDIVYLVEQGLKRLDDFQDFQKYEIGTLSEEEAALLQEQYLISPALCKEKRGATFVFNDNNVSIMVNEEDHLREQYIFKEPDLFKAYEHICAIDDALGSVFDFAFDKKLGFVTSCPSNLGTGMRASVMLFLPGLVFNGTLKNLLPTLKSEGLTVRGAFGEGSMAEGYVYQISNERTLGMSEEQILTTVTQTASKLCHFETEARREMLETSKLELRDRCLRAYGTLRYCALLSLKECMAKLADIKMGIVLNFFSTKNLEEFDAFVDGLRPTAFKVENRLWEATETECDRVRAQIVGGILPELVWINSTQGDKE